MKNLNRYRGCLLGLAAGDAAGSTLEFKPRGAFEPINDMVGGGPYHLQPGQWTDDTSMALCLATSLVECGGFDPRDQMTRYTNWYSQGYLSSTGVCFDIGNTVRAALLRFAASGEPYSGSSDPMSAGNGSLMRLAPVPMAFFPNRASALHFAVESSRTTHAASECLDACMVFADMLLRALSGADKSSILLGSADLKISSPAIRKLAQGSYQEKTVDQIIGSGYVVRSMEAALWCFWTTDSFRGAVLRAVNLGEDADTTAAITGQLAGAFYGMRAIPAGWLKKLTMRQEITLLADQLQAGEM